MSNFENFRFDLQLIGMNEFFFSFSKNLEKPTHRSPTKKTSPNGSSIEAQARWTVVHYGIQYFVFSEREAVVYALSCRTLMYGDFFFVGSFRTFLWNKINFNILIEQFTATKNVDEQWWDNLNGSHRNWNENNFRGYQLKDITLSDATMRQTL